MRYVHRNSTLGREKENADVQLSTASLLHFRPRAELWRTNDRVTPRFERRRSDADPEGVEPRTARKNLQVGWRPLDEKPEIKTDASFTLLSASVSSAVIIFASSTVPLPTLDSTPERHREPSPRRRRAYPSNPGRLHDQSACCAHGTFGDVLSRMCVVETVVLSTKQN